jgi:hypothetical protein
MVVSESHARGVTERLDRNGNHSDAKNSLTSSATNGTIAIGILF